MAKVATDCHVYRERAATPRRGLMHRTTSVPLHPRSIRGLEPKQVQDLLHRDLSANLSKSTPGTVVPTRLHDSNSRPLECHSSSFAHFDCDSMIRHHLRGENDERTGLAGAQTSQNRRSGDGLGSCSRTANATLLQASTATPRSSTSDARLRRVLKDRPLPYDATHQSPQ